MDQLVQFISASITDKSSDVDSGISAGGGGGASSFCTGFAPSASSGDISKSYGCPTSLQQSEMRGIKQEGKTNIID